MLEKAHWVGTLGCHCKGLLKRREMHASTFLQLFWHSHNKNQCSETSGHSVYFQFPTNKIAKKAEA